MPMMDAHVPSLYPETSSRVTVPQKCTENHSVHSMPCHNARVIALFVVPFNVQYIQHRQYIRLLRRPLRLCDCHCLYQCICHFVMPIADAMYRDIIFAVPFVMCESPMSTFFDLIKRCQKTVKYLSQL